MRGFSEYFANKAETKKIVGRKVVALVVINHPLQYGGKKLGHPVYGALMLLNFCGDRGRGLEARTKLLGVSN